MSQISTLMTAEEFLALPDDGMERDLIRGEIREKPMTRRNRDHSGVEAKIAALLIIWLLQQPVHIRLQSSSTCDTTLK